MGSIGELFKNPLFLQFMTAAGQDIAAPPGSQIGANIAGAVNQGIQTKSLTALLAKMLGGSVPTGGKVTIDEKGVSALFPKTALDSPEFKLSPGANDLVPNPSSKIPSNPSAPAGGAGLVNPFSTASLGEIFSNLDAADLAGLTPQDITQALHSRFTQDQLAQQSVAEANQTMYQQGMMRSSHLNAESEAFRAQTSRLTEARQWKELMRESPIPIPGLDRPTFAEWEALDTKSKAYSFYAFNQNRNGLPFKSYDDWANQEKPENIENIYERAKTDKGFSDFYFKSKEAGATRINTESKVRDARALADIKGELYFKDPGWFDDVTKYLKDESVDNEIFAESKQRKVPEADVREEKALEYIKKKIATGGGVREKVVMTPDGKTMIITVRWRTGEVTDVRYPIR